MILLDSDHLTVLKYRGSERYIRLTERLQAAANQAVGTTFINVEEQMRGWLAAIAKERQISRQVSAYRELAGLFDFFGELHIVTLSSEAAAMFQEMRASGVKIGTMDLKTACIAINSNALLLTRNRRDFERVPGLRFENWIDESS